MRKRRLRVSESEAPATSAERQHSPKHPLPSAQDRVWNASTSFQHSPDYSLARFLYLAGFLVANAWNAVAKSSDCSMTWFHSSV